MKKKILTKHILMALAMAAMVPAGQAWATLVYLDGTNDIDDITTNKGGFLAPSTLRFTSAANSQDGKNWVMISHTGEYNEHLRDPAIAVSGNAGDLREYNFDVTVGALSWTPNSDALRVTGSNAGVQLGDFKADVGAINSDAITIGDETCGSSVTVNNFTADVDYGSGIRVNAYKWDEPSGTTSATVAVIGATKITINGNAWQQDKDHDTADLAGAFALHILGVPVPDWVTLQKGAGVYAGYDEAWGKKNINSAAAELNGDVDITLNAEGGAYGLWAGRNGSITVGKSLTITANQANSDGIAATNTDYNTLAAGGDNTYGSRIELNGGSGSSVNINMNGSENGMENSHAIYANGKNTSVKSGEQGIGHFDITGDIAAENGGMIKLQAVDKVDEKGQDVINSLTGNLTADGEKSYASLDGYNVEMTGNASATAGGHVALTSESYGSLFGALTASGEKSQASMTSKGVNYVDSAAVIAHAGDLDQDKATDNNMSEKQVISALYAEDGAAITVSGQSNTFRTTANPNNSDQLERVIWAYNGADITVGGTTTISTDSYEKSANSNDIAIAAGTAVGISADTDFNTSVNRAEVNLNYGAGSSVTGDIIAGYAGEVNISRALDAGDAGIQVEGNLLAGNNGILNVDLGNGGTLTGRADDYGDAGVIDGSGHGTSFFDPAFSSSILKGGAVNLTMGAGSTWKVTGQSWITSIDTNAAGKTADVLAAENPSDAIKNMATIDLVQSNTNYNNTAHALTIYEMNGDAVFNMSLAGNRSYSDMLYMKKANGEYIVNLKEAVGVDDMFASMGSDGKTFTGLRFATVGADSGVSFHVFAKDTGMQNIEYTVETDKYKENEENAAYDSTDGTGAANEQKPGTNMVEGFFNSEGIPPTDSGEESANGQIMLLAAGDEAAGTSTATTETTNFKLTGIKGTELSDAGKTVVNMSKVNYSNAVYMDRLNKRMGEARYIDGDDGLWVRMRHDRIGKDNAFRSMNTMMELGYDRKVQSQKNGEHRWGVAFDYMRGTADYTNVMGSGDVRRAGVWLYDTWLGDKGHYTDYVVKYGHLSNDFDIYAQSSGNKISGDYNNDVWSASAEYGRKKDIGNEWYFEPQVQAQYAYVTSADYTTSQDTKVHLDSIDSLIGRAGFRLGRDTDEANTVYFKADILHEFLGGQSIRAMDTTTNGVLTTTYENEGTWYDVGFGFSHRMGKDSYMFLDVEHSFGNDNEDTYQINIGLNRAF